MAEVRAFPVFVPLGASNLLAPIDSVQAETPDSIEKLERQSGTAR